MSRGKITGLAWRFWFLSHIALCVACRAARRLASRLARRVENDLAAWCFWCSVAHRVVRGVSRCALHIASRCASLVALRVESRIALCIMCTCVCLSVLRTRVMFTCFCLSVLVVFVMCAVNALMTGQRQRPQAP